jgi:hypothetical protein
MDDVRQAAKLSLHLKQLGLHQHAKDRHAPLVVAGFVQHAIDVCLITPKVFMLFKEPVTFVDGFLQLGVEIVLHTFVPSSFAGKCRTIQGKWRQTMQFEVNQSGAGC